MQKKVTVNGKEKMVDVKNHFHTVKDGMDVLWHNMSRRTEYKAADAELISQKSKKVSESPVLK